MYIENRGTDEVPFGFVYADADTRACFAVTDGKLTIGGPGSGYWFAMDQHQLKQAARSIVRRFALVEVGQPVLTRR